MGGTIKKLNFCAAVALVLFSVISFRMAFASVNCSAESSPQTVLPGSDNNLQFRLINPTGQGNDPIRWIRISRPSADFSIENASAGGWSSSTTASTALLTGGTLNTGTVLTANVTAAAANFEAKAANWQIEVSSDAAGGSPSSCSGNLRIEISDGNGPIISNIFVSNITASSAVINWTTDEPATSSVNYDLSSDYNNSSDYDSNLVTNHSVALSGLSADTGYHFQVSSNDGANNGTNSEDNTFMTAAESQTGGSGTGDSTGKNQSNSSPLQVKITNPGDKIPPTIALTTQLPRVVQNMPTISGIATDDSAVARVEYSTDGGRNWLPVNNLSGLGGKNVQFNFTPGNLDDGNYQVEARAIDGGGNITLTQPQKVVVDRLPPIVGGYITSLGPQILSPAPDGSLRTTTGIDQTLVLSAVGGPTAIYITAQKVGGSAESSNFNLTQSPDTGLWRGIVSFGTAGNYKLTTYSQDGAGNKTVKDLGNIQVSRTGKIVQKGSGQPVDSAKISVYYLEPESNNWTLWDADAYGQNNPLTADKNGAFSLFLPAGKYYLDVSAHGYHSVKTSIFALNSPTTVLPVLTMSKSHFFGLAWPSFDVQKVNPSISAADLKPTNTNITLKDKQLLGKPTLISFGATWLPAASDQMAELAALQTDQTKYNIVAVGVDEHHAKLLSYNSILGANVTWSDDPDGAMAASYEVQSLPTYYFFNKQGNLKHVSYANLTKQEILNTLARLQ